MLKYTGYNDHFKITNDLIWPDSIVCFVLYAENEGTDIISLIFDNNTEISLCLTTEDLRSPNKNKCKNGRNKGCCAEHDSCGNYNCTDHYPLQKLYVECKGSDLLNQKIIDFKREDEYDAFRHNFYFFLNNGTRVPIVFTNSDPSMYIKIYVSTL